MNNISGYPFFDSHFHIIDKDFPLIENNGFLPDYFSLEDYQQRMSAYDLQGGALVSGSFQGFDQSYLCHALKILGDKYVGVTQLPISVSDNDVLSLDNTGIRGVRFNLKRGLATDLAEVEFFAKRIYELAGWHIELYIDSAELDDVFSTLIKLPKLSIAHLGLSKIGFPTLLKLAEKNVLIKATGFYRVDFDVSDALKSIVSCNNKALVFGSDLPSTRASRPYSDADFNLVIDTLGEDLAKQVFYDNAANFYLER